MPAPAHTAYSAGIVRMMALWTMCRQCVGSACNAHGAYTCLQPLDCGRCPWYHGAMSDFSVAVSGDGFVVTGTYDDAPMGMGSMTLSSAYASDGSPVPTFDHLVPEIPMDSIGMGAFSRVVDAFIPLFSGSIGEVKKHHDWCRVLAYVASMADSPENNALVREHVDMPSKPRSSNRSSKYSSAYNAVNSPALGNGPDSNRSGRPCDTRLKRTIRLVSCYGPNAVSLYQRGITDDAVRRMFMVDARNLGVQRLMTMYALLHCRSEYEALSVDDAVNRYGLHYEDAHHNGLTMYVPVLSISDDGSTGYSAEVVEKIPNYPVFTDDSIRIMNVIGIDKVVSLIDLIGKVPCGSNGLSTADLYRVAYDVLGYADPTMYETLEKTLETMRGSALPVVPGRNFTAEWVRDKAGMPLSVYLDDLSNGVYADSVATELRDGYFTLMQRIMDSPLVGYETLLERNDTWVSNAGTVIHSWSGQPVSCRNNLAERMSLDDQMDKPWDVAVLLMCMTHDDGESRLLYRFMGMTGWFMLASMQKYVGDTRGMKSSYLTEHMKNRPDAGMMHRVNNVLSWLCDMDEDTFKRILSIPFNAINYETPTSMVMYYDKGDITNAPLHIMMNDDENTRTNPNDMTDSEYNALFPGSLERITAWFESVMESVDGQSNGITRLTRLSTAISNYDHSGSMLYPESFDTVEKRDRKHKTKARQRLSAIPYDEKMSTMISKNNAISYPETSNDLLFTSAYDAYYSSPCYDQLHTPASIMEKKYIASNKPLADTLPIRTMDDDGYIISENTTLVSLFPDMDTYINDENPANTKKTQAIERQAKRIITKKRVAWNAVLNP